ncbi:hypothetical protein OJ997_16535 [Solirubrobacter phytolaccae]|uniref:Uncharacterized protein n=1 Tax=Solirubrobacter phytolaccae TaxID=1404360 RepID=A0A9X3NBW2_9ACTN|nr:hypothetical protein [Solirubrobacter phytolaccae]MDA0181912.1 hypothetical protein [Solirubrobacter phytolaccae]
MSPAPHDVILIHQCIGCGAIETPQPCLGGCHEHRLDLVPAEEHEAAAATVDALERLLAERERLLRDVAHSTLSDEEWAALRTRARAALHTPPIPEPADTVTTWKCDCGHIEAPQPCIGVCVRPERAMVPADEYTPILARATELAAHAERLSPALRLLAWTTPRPDHREATATALRTAAMTCV